MLRVYVSRRCRSHRHHHPRSTPHAVAALLSLSLRMWRRPSSTSTRSRQCKPTGLCSSVMATATATAAAARSVDLRSVASAMMTCASHNHHRLCRSSLCRRPASGMLDEHASVTSGVRTATNGGGKSGATDASGCQQWPHQHLHLRCLTVQPRTWSWP